MSRGLDSLMANLNQLIRIAGIEALENAELLNDNRRRFRVYDDPFQESEQGFIKLYRLSKNSTVDLIDLLTPHMSHPSRLSALSIERKVLTALRFFASGSYQLDVGNNINHGMSQPSVSRCIEEVSTALNIPEIFNRFVKMPRNFDEIRQIRTKFYLNHDFPGVLGCVDCTHVAIYPPETHHPIYPEAVYVNRKGYHSINLQLICDDDLRIMNVCARYLGSTHDSFIWNNSDVLPFMQNLHRNNNRVFLLGDSGYALRPWLMTPVENPGPDSPEERYNNRQMSTRSLIERCNGVLKLRFRCLLKHRVLHYSPEKSSKIINACVILHNICINNNIPPVELGEDRGDENLGEVDFGIYEPENNALLLPNPRNPELIAGRLLRERVIRSHFTIRL